MKRKHSQRERIWQAMRIFRRFTYADLVRTTGIDICACRLYTGGLVGIGVVREDGLRSNRRKIFRIVIDKGPEAPGGIYTDEAVKKRSERVKNRTPPELDLEVKALFSKRTKRGEVKALAEKYGIAVQTVRHQAKRLGVEIARHEWSAGETRILEANPDKKTREIAVLLAGAGFRRTPSAIDIYKYRRNKRKGNE